MQVKKGKVSKKHKGLNTVLHLREACSGIPDARCWDSTHGRAAGRADEELLLHVRLTKALKWNTLIFNNEIIRRITKLLV